MEGIADRFRSLRERLGKSLDEIADASGISFCNIRDLEWYDDEFDDATSIEDVERVCNALGTSCHELVRGMSGTSAATAKRILPDDIAHAVRLHLASSRISLGQFEDEVGWELQAFLDDPKSYWNWNIRCLQDVCAAIHLDWIAALP
jgi:transcriptional regulator with XRE-family HTH domain